MVGVVPASSYPAGVPLTGALPNGRPDRNASIFFIVVYSLLLPLVAFRVFAKSSRCQALIRPAIFVLSRIGAFVVRVLQANGNHSKNLLISEQVIMQCGFILLLDPLLRFAAYHIQRNETAKLRKRPSALRWAIIGLQVILLAALALIIFASTQYGNLAKPATRSAVQKSREASAILVLIVCAFCGVTVSVAHKREDLPAKQSATLVTMCLLLTITSVYKIISYFSPPSETNLPPKILFYVLTSTPELLVAILIFLPNVVIFYAIDQSRLRGHEQKILDAEARHRAYESGGGAFTHMSSTASTSTGLDFGRRPRVEGGSEENHSMDDFKTGSV